MSGSYRDELRTAVQDFWRRRAGQSERQGASSGKKDQGGRTAVTAGGHLDAFLNLIGKIVMDAGLSEQNLRVRRSDAILPGYFRPHKAWDLLVVRDERLLAVVEFKSQVGPSFGNNYNNRTEEAIGNAHDLWTAYREGAFAPKPKPWLGYLMVLEDADGSSRPVGVREPNFPVFEPFRDASYAGRYRETLTRLVRERLYDEACLLLTPAKQGLKSGDYTEPSEELSFDRFADALSRALRV